MFESQELSAEEWAILARIAGIAGLRDEGGARGLRVSKG